ncbi:hypothetical protein EGT07_25625 [Herbaspirillum sp. HC18]|nr:hypothetical protein EGT07_25625 [Herbaspirillum sp. HC18]
MWFNAGGVHMTFPFSARHDGRAWEFFPSGRLTVAATLLTLASVAFAADVLPLAEAQRLAVERSRQVAAQDAGITGSRELAVAAGQLPDPVLKAGIDNLPVNGPDRGSLTADFMTMRRIGVMQELTRSDKRALRSERYARAADKDLAEKDKAIAAVERETALAWLDRYYAESAASIIASQRDQAQRERQAAEAAFRAGRGSQADVLAAKSVVAQFDDRADDAARRVRNAQTMLARWVGDAAGQRQPGGVADPAPLEMFETTIQFKPREQWRPGMTPDKLVAELDRIVKVPGLSNIWVPPIRNRIDMLATGIKSPVGVKVAGMDLKEIDRITGEIERAVKKVPGVSSALAERLNGGRYIDVKIDRDAAARYGLNIADVQSIVSAAIGGDNIGETVEGLQRFPINMRYPREVRDSVEKLRDLPVLTERGAQIRLGDVAAIRIDDGPPMLKSENARLSGWVYVDIRGRDLSSAVREMQQVVAKEVKLPAGYSVSWSGQFEYLERATAKLKIVVPATLLIIFVLLYMTFKRFDEAALIMATLPFALAGGVWLLWLLGHNLSVASGVGFIALAGVSAEFGVIMLIYLKNAWEARLADGRNSEAALIDAIREGAVLRVRPKAMTVAVIIAGLVPIMIGAGTGSEVMQRIAAPMVGGMVTAPLLSMFVVPVVYLLLRRRQLHRARLVSPVSKKMGYGT